MEEKTTTNAPVDDGAVTAQPEATEQVEAVETQPETTESEAQAEDNESKEQQETTEPEEDNSEWLKSKGIDPTDPEAVSKLAKSYREAEKKLSQTAQKASELEKDLSSRTDEYAEEVAEQTGQDPELLKTVQRLQVKDLVRDFYSQNPDARDMESEMVKTLAEKPHLAGDLEALYYVTKSKMPDTSKSQVKRETLEALAQKQTASAPSGNANSPVSRSNAITPQNVDSMVAQMSMEEYKRRLPEINKALNQR